MSGVNASSSHSLRAFIERIGVPIVDEKNLDEILSREGAPGAVLLLFAGDPGQRAEVSDVAVIFPELLKSFKGRLEGAVVALGAEKALGQRFHVDVLPSLAVSRGGATIGVIPRIRDWAEYIEKIEAFLDLAAPSLAKPSTPRVEITFSQKGASA
ncbi:MAG: hydrogenase accessory protein [Chloroflexota bacterium]